MEEMKNRDVDFIRDKIGLGLIKEYISRSRNNEKNRVTEISTPEENNNV